MITDIWTKLFLSLSTLECDNLDKDTETIWHKMINQKSHMPQTFSKIPSSTPQKWRMFNLYADR